MNNPENQTPTADSGRLPDAACSPGLHREWTLLFDTHDDMCHPTRITFRTPGSEADARRHGELILREEAKWLKGLSQCYPTRANAQAHL